MLGLGSRLRWLYERLAVLPLLLVSARYHRYRDNPRAAKDRLQRAVVIAPASFSIHLRLGALYLDEHDFTRARREFLLARQLNPGKFRRLYPLITGRSGDININLFYFPGFTDHEPEQASADFLREFLGGPLEKLAGKRSLRTDFLSRREAGKFRELGPIREDEVRQVDWDDLARRLTDLPPEE
jgi:hypothetical protein